MAKFDHKFIPEIVVHHGTRTFTFESDQFHDTFIQVSNILHETTDEHVKRRKLSLLASKIEDKGVIYKNRAGHDTRHIHLVEMVHRVYKFLINRL